MHDLSKKSQAMVNSLVPRNPIQPKNGPPLPSHSQFGSGRKSPTQVVRCDESVSRKKKHKLSTGRKQSSLQ